jgi:hypothetical protein
MLQVSRLYNNGDGAINKYEAIVMRAYRKNLSAALNHVLVSFFHHKKLTRRFLESNSDRSQLLILSAMAWPAKYYPNKSNKKYSQSLDK